MRILHMKRQLAHAQVWVGEAAVSVCDGGFPHPATLYSSHALACSATDYFIKTSSGLWPGYRCNECGGKERWHPIYLRLFPHPGALPLSHGCVYCKVIWVCAPGVNMWGTLKISKQIVKSLSISKLLLKNDWLLICSVCLQKPSFTSENHCNHLMCHFILYLWFPCGRDQHRLVTGGEL